MSNLLLEHEAEELARLVLGLDDDVDDCEIDDALIDKFNISFEEFHKIASALVMFTLPFQRDDEKHYCFIENHGGSLVRSVARIIVKKAGE